MSAATASHHPPPPLVDQPPLKQQRTGAFDPFAQAQYSAFHAPMLQPPPQQPQMQTPNGMYSPPGTMQMWPPGASPQPLQQLSPYPMQSSPHMMQQQYQQYLQPFPPSFGHFPPQQQMPGFSSDGNGGGMHFLQSPPGGMMNGPGMPLQMQMQNGDFVNMVPMQLMQQMNGGATAEQQQQQHQQQIQQQIQQQQQQQQQAPQPSGRNSMNFSCHQCHTTYDEGSLMFCTTLPNGTRKRRCRKKYCHSCLSRYYDFKLSAQTPSSVSCWNCPACQNKCTCVRCKKEREWQEGTQTGAIQSSVHTVKAPAAERVRESSAASSASSSSAAEKKPSPAVKAIKEEKASPGKPKPHTTSSGEHQTVSTASPVSQSGSTPTAAAPVQAAHGRRSMHALTMGLLAAAAVDEAATAAALATFSSQSTSSPLPPLEGPSTSASACAASAMQGVESTIPRVVKEEGLPTQPDLTYSVRQTSGVQHAPVAGGQSLSGAVFLSPQPQQQPHTLLPLPIQPPSLLYTGGPLSTQMYLAATAGSSAVSCNSSLQAGSLPLSGGLLPSVTSFQLEPMDRCVYIMRGLPGSGKSALAAQIIAQATMRPPGPRGAPSGVICSADHFFDGDATLTTCGGGGYKFDPSRLGEAHAYCLTMYMQALGSGIGCVVVDNTNCTLWEYRNYQLAAALLGYYCVVLEIVCDSEATARRMHARHTHQVGLHQHLAMLQRFEADVTTRKLLPVFAQAASSSARRQPLTSPSRASASTCPSEVLATNPLDIHTKPTTPATTASVQQHDQIEHPPTSDSEISTPA